MRARTGLTAGRGRDALGAAAFAVISLVPTLGQYGLVLGELPVRPDDAWRVLLIAGQTLPLAVRRRLPGTCLAVVGAAFAVMQCAGYAPSPAGLGLLAALYSAGAHLRRRRTLVAGTCVVAYVVLAVVLRALGSPETGWQLATFAPVLAAAWGVGEVVRVRAAAARSHAALVARSAVLDERARLARELHDVVSHHVTGMVVQADAAAFLLPASEERVRAGLAAISGSGRRALDDLRRLLDVLGSDDVAAGPPIGALGDLVADAGRAGQDVRLEEDGAPRGPDDVRLAVYRIVQEGLTNARKHAPGSPVHVCARWTAQCADVRVLSAAAPSGRVGPPVPSPVAPGGGHGLAGLGERVRLLGGRLTAGPADAGGWLLHAVLPLPTDPAASLTADSHAQEGPFHG